MAASKAGRLIVVAVDLGEESLYALTWCLNNVVGKSAADEDSKDTLVLLYARPHRAVYPSIDGTGYLFSPDILSSVDRYGQEVSDLVMEKAKRICSSHHQNVNMETRVETGDARDVICEAVQKLNADLLVMGSHGYGLIQRAFLGSVSNHCAQAVKCPVLIVKRPKQ